MHGMCNLLSAANHRHRQVIAALVRTIFVQPDAATATIQVCAVVEQHLRRALAACQDEAHLMVIAHDPPKLGLQRRISSAPLRSEGSAAAREGASEPHGLPT